MKPYAATTRLMVALLAAGWPVCHAHAQAPQTAKSLVCTTGPGVYTAWSGVDPVTKDSRNDVSFTFSDLNERAKTARLTGAAGSGPVEMIVTPAAVTFVERTAHGGLFFTTVYSSLHPTARTYRAVDTRHNILLGEPSISQYFGWCKPQF